MITWKFEIETTVGKNPPAFRVISDSHRQTVTWDENCNTIEFASDYPGLLAIDYFSKQEQDTITDKNGHIVKDTMWRIKRIWCENILLEQWFVNDAVYYPRYFKNFIEQFPASPDKIKSPYQFNFPGLIKWQWDNNMDFWDWYFIEKNKREDINFLENDPERVWKYRGSLDPCEDLVVNIKELLEL